VKCPVPLFSGNKVHNPKPKRRILPSILCGLAGQPIIPWDLLRNIYAYSRVNNEKFITLFVE